MTRTTWPSRRSMVFSRPSYVGDPLNTVCIFNEMEVDEIFFLDIGVAKTKSTINWPLIERLAMECFMPFAYGGDIRTVDDIGRLYALGAETWSSTPSPTATDRS